MYGRFHFFSCQFISACLSASHEPRPCGEPDPCAPAFPALPRHAFPWSGFVGSLHARDTAPCCPGATKAAATQLEGEGERTWEPITKRIQGLRGGINRRELTNTDFSTSASAPQNASPAPVSVSANQTREYTAARRAVSMPEQPITIVILLIYRSLGAALPPKYHADRRGVRWEWVKPRRIQMCRSGLYLLINNKSNTSLEVHYPHTIFICHFNLTVLLEIKK